MNKKLYLVRITRLVLAATASEAQRLACNPARHSDADCVEVIAGLYDLPPGWEGVVPCGANQVSAYQILVAQIANQPRFTGFEVHACLTTGEDEHGRTILEQCADSAASLWSVYGQLVTGGLECLGDFDSPAKARAFLADIEQAVLAAEIQQPEQAEDAHLESLYEERVSCGNYEEF